MTNLLLLALFVGSGAAALIYEVVWQQLLQFVIGSSTISLGVLLATYMGGLCLGSLTAPRLLSRRLHPLRTYAWLEVAIGVSGVLLLWGIPLVNRIYAAAGLTGAADVVLRALVAALCMVPPTWAMGATLPIVARWVEATGRGRDWLGFFYAGNLAGAVAGCLIAGFYLLRVFDMAVATAVAAALNGSVAIVAWRLATTAANEERQTARVGELDAVVSRRGLAGDDASPQGRRADTVTASAANDSGPTPAWRAYGVAALSGFCALAAEVVWTRQLALMFSATVYTFTIILAVFLIGLGAGSTAGAALVRRVRWPLRAAGVCQVLAAVSVVWSAQMLSNSLPYWPVNSTLATSIWFNFQLDFVRALWAILPAPVFWGASFPLLLAAAARRDTRADTTVGRVYAANTVGAILGALMASVVLIPLTGSPRTQQVMLAVAAAAAALAFLRGPGRVPRLAAALGVAAFGVPLIPPLPAVLVTHGRHAASWAGYPEEVLFVGEGMHASVAVTRTPGGALNYHNAGKVQASSEPADMRLQRMLGHLTTLLPARPRSVLVIGCGAGVTAGAVSVNPGVERVTIVDIEPLVPRVARDYLGSVNHDVLKNAKVRVVADDARHFLQTTDETFDAITSDPLDPWVKGAASLYTREFFETARRHLNPGGVMTLYVQLFESSPATVKSEIGTFFEVFPEGLLFGNTFDGHAIDTVVVGQSEPPQIWLDSIEETLRHPAFTAVDQSLMQAGLYGAVELFGNYAGRARELKGWLADAQINQDRDLRLQFLAGYGVNQHSGDDIYRDILSYRSFPDDLFVASESTLDRVRDAMSGVRE